MKFDKGDRTFDKEFFEYVEDPTIESAESGVAGQVSCDIFMHFVV
jgi:plexin A